MRAINLGIVLTLVFSPAVAQMTDQKESRNYQLTMQKIVRYDAAVQALEAAFTSDEGLRAEKQKMVGEFAQTLTASKSSLNRHPRILAFYTKEKLTLDDAVLIPWVLRNACRAAEVPELAKTLDYTDAQVQFCNMNRAALHKLKLFQPARPVLKRQ